jgi:signal transduction histidine kinase
MTRMLDDLLYVARIATGKISIQLENIDLRDILRDLVEENEENANNAGIRFVFTISDKPCPVRADRVRLSQIIDNVLTNAIKFTPAKGHVVIRLYAEGGSVLLRIADSGVGFDRELAERLFQPFVQGKQEIDRINGRASLGLAISRKLAELQSGSLTAESPGSGRGAAFTLTLPLVEEAASIPSVKLDEPKARRIRVLIIEDNKDTADTMGGVNRSPR